MSKQRELTADDITYLKTALHAATGVDFSRYKQDFLARSVTKRMQALALAEPREYVEALRRDSEETARFMESFTVYFSRFMRDPAKYSALKDSILPEMVRCHACAPGEKRLRIWSAGCAGGEEPYSIAMILLEVFSGALAEWRLGVTATDVNRRLLAKAAAGEYHVDEFKVRDIDEYYMNKYFEPAGDRLRVKDEVRRLVTFEQGNLITGGVRRGMDIIFCRNVLIYFEPEAVKKILLGFHESLNAHGYLFLGNAEIMDDCLACHFQKVKVHGEFIYRKIVAGSAEHRAAVEKRKSINAALGVRYDTPC